MEERACQTPKEDLMNSALDHYDEASTAIHYWSSDIPKAIRHYYMCDQKLNKVGWFSFGISIGLLTGIAIGVFL